MCLSWYTAFTPGWSEPSQNRVSLQMFRTQNEEQRGAIKEGNRMNTTLCPSSHKTYADIKQNCGGETKICDCTDDFLIILSTF